MSQRCASCGAEHAPGSRFCSTCGAPLVISCAACGVENHAAASFCSACGTALAAGARRGNTVDEREERRIVTILFADLAGSTALSERLDPEEVRSLQTELYDLLAEQVELVGGTTEKFVGDAVLAVFGTPVAHEDDPERAVRAALGARQAFAAFAKRVKERHDADVALRVGVNTGDVVAGREAAARGEMMVSGDAVNVAARLQQAAARGEVLVGERTYSATRRMIVYEGPRSIEARGKTEPLQAWSALGTADVGERGPGERKTRLVGRGSELAVLTALAGRVERERVPQLVTVLGNAGVGKSRLLAEVGDRLLQSRVAVGGCLPYGDGITYWPLAEIAREEAGVLDSDSADAALAKLEAWVGSAVPASQAGRILDAVAWTIGLALPDSELAGSSEVRDLLHAAWARLISALAAEQLVVIAIEDVHWASDALLDLLEHLADRLVDAPVLIVCTARPEFLDTRPAWGGAKPNALSLTLSPLSAAESRTLIASLLGAGGDTDERLWSLLERAEGNPFFLEEIVQMLIDQGALEQHDGRWSPTERLSAVPLPDSVHGVIAARIDLLDPLARDALRRCAVMGREFWPNALGIPDDSVGALLEKTLAFEVPTPRVEGLREFAFKHALIQEVAYASLPRTERRGLHREVAEWLAGAVPGREAETVEIAAYHYGEALRYGEDDPDVRERAFDALMAAGEASLSRGAILTAEALFTRALEAAPERAGEALFGAGRAQYLGQSGVARATTLFEQGAVAAAEAGDVRLYGDLLGWLSRACWTSGRWEEALENANRAVEILERLPESPQYARALARRSQIAMLRDSPDAVEHADAAIAAAGRVGDRFAEANARINRFTALGWLGVPPEPDELFEVLDLATSAGAWEEAYRAIGNFLWDAQAYGPVPEVEHFVVGALARLEEIPPPSGYGRYMEMSLAKHVYLPSGRWAEAEAELVEPTHGVAGNLLIWLELEGMIALARGDLEAADERIVELREIALASHESQRIVPMATLAAARADLADDADTVTKLAEHILRLGPRWTSVLPGAPLAAVLARRESTLPALRGLHEVFVEASKTAGASRHVATSLSVAEGLLTVADGDAQEGADLIRRGISIEQEAGRTYRAAYLELELARALAAAGDEAGAGEARQRAAGVLEPLGVVNPV